MDIFEGMGRVILNKNNKIPENYYALRFAIVVTWNV